MALPATLHTFDIDLADADRGVYETLALRVARHPSESEEFLAARVLAYCLEYTDGIAFSSGLSTPDEPPISVRDLTGAMRAWVEIGLPDADRLRRASTTAARVAVYAHRDPTQWLRNLSGTRLPHAEAIELYAFDPACLAGLVGRLERRLSLSVSIADRALLIAMDTAVIEGEVSVLAPPWRTERG